MLYIVFNSLRRRINRYSYFGIYKGFVSAKKSSELVFFAFDFHYILDNIGVGLGRGVTQK